MYAASLNPNPSMVSLLVDAGADLGARTVRGLDTTDGGSFQFG